VTLLSLPMIAFWTTFDRSTITTMSSVSRPDSPRLPVALNRIAMSR